MNGVSIAVQFLLRDKTQSRKDRVRRSGYGFHRLEYDRRVIWPGTGIHVQQAAHTYARAHQWKVKTWTADGCTVIERLK